MTIWKIFRFEFSYQIRRISFWLTFIILAFVAFVQTIARFVEGAGSTDHFVNAPFVVATGVAIGCLAWLLLGAGIAGSVAARDPETGMDPLTYTSAVTKTAYLAGRFVTAFALNGLVLLALPVGIGISILLAQLPPEVMGPFRLDAYVTSYAFLALPMAFVATGIQFSFAVLGRRSLASFLGSLLILAVAGGVWLVLDRQFARLLDPTGLVALLRGEVTGTWSSAELNSRLPALEGIFQVNHLLWTGVTLGILTFVRIRFRFAHPESTSLWKRIKGRRDHPTTPPAETATEPVAPISIPLVVPGFMFSTYLHQIWLVARTSLRYLLVRRSSLVLLAIVAAFALLTVPVEFMNVPLIPRTDLVIFGMNNPDAPPAYLVFPLLIVFWTGLLFWRERDAGLDEIIDATPVPDPVLMLGKLLALALVIGCCLAIRMGAGMFLQLSSGVADLQVERYLQMFFGLDFTSYFLLAVLVFSVNVMVNRRHMGRLVVLFLLFWIAVALGNGIGHGLLIPGGGPDWLFTEMRRYGGSLGPWLWFKSYWAAWTLLMLVVVRLLWVRGKERGFRMRLHMARRRLSGRSIAVALVAIGSILSIGGFVFYNTNVLNEYTTASDLKERRAAYELRYKQYENDPQPRLAATNLAVDIHPERGELEIRGTWLLVNDTAVPIDTIHLSTEASLDSVTFDRPARTAVEDDVLGHRSFILENPLTPGDSTRLQFDMKVSPNGFTTRGRDLPVHKNGTYIRSLDWLPALGYQPRRELEYALDRQPFGLAPRPELPSPFDLKDEDLTSPRDPGMEFEAVVSTAEGQMAIAPGELRRSWEEDGRRYFHYVSKAPIGIEYGLFSADYALYEGNWVDAESGREVSIQVYHLPGLETNRERMVRSAQAALTHYSEQFGSYPFGHVRIVERPGFGRGMHADANTIDHEGGFALLNPGDGPWSFDLPFFVVAHEVAHQWWGYQLSPARAEGGGLLVESLASYSAYQVVENTFGHDHMYRLLNQLRQSYQVPRSRVAAPLIRANDAFQYYRKGPFSLYAMSRYLGREPVNGVLRQMLEQHLAGALPRPTSLDLYRRLQSVTPDSVRGILHDLFEQNIYWEFEALRADARQIATGDWEVTLHVQARKVVVDESGVETELPLDDLIEIGVFGTVPEGSASSESLYRGFHRIQSGTRSITITVPDRPFHAGIDPYNLLIDLGTGDNVVEVDIPD